MQEDKKGRVTREDVKQLCTNLTEKHQEFGTRSLQQQLGGSLSTITQFYKEWLQEKHALLAAMTSDIGQNVLHAINNDYLTRSSQKHKVYEEQIKKFEELNEELLVIIRQKEEQFNKLVAESMVKEKDFADRTLAQQKILAENNGKITTLHNTLKKYEEEIAKLKDENKAFVEGEGSKKELQNILAETKAKNETLSLKIEELIEKGHKLEVRAVTAETKLAR